MASLAKSHYIDRDSDSRHSVANAIRQVKGSIKRSENWWNFYASVPIKCIVQYGYLLPFMALPPSTFERNTKSALDEPGFVAEAIQELVDSGVVEDLSIQPWVVNPLTVARGKTLRLVLDLRNVNEFVKLERIKYEDIKVASLYP